MQDVLYLSSLRGREGEGTARPEGQGTRQTAAQRNQKPGVRRAGTVPATA